MRTTSRMCRASAGSPVSSGGATDPPGPSRRAGVLIRMPISVVLRRLSSGGTLRAGDTGPPAAWGSPTVDPVESTACFRLFSTTRVMHDACQAPGRCLAKASAFGPSWQRNTTEPTLPAFGWRAAEPRLLAPRPARRLRPGSRRIAPDWRTAHVRIRHLAQRSPGRCQDCGALGGRRGDERRADHARAHPRRAGRGQRTGCRAHAEASRRAVRHRRARALPVQGADGPVHRPCGAQREDRAPDLVGDLRSLAGIPDCLPGIRAHRVRERVEREMAQHDSGADLPPRRPPRPRRQGAPVPLRDVDSRQVGRAARARRAGDLHADRATGDRADAGAPGDIDRTPVPDDAGAAAHRFRQHDRAADRAIVGGARRLVRVAAPFAVGRASPTRSTSTSRAAKG